MSATRAFVRAAAQAALATLVTVVASGAAAQAAKMSPPPPRAPALPSSAPWSGPTTRSGVFTNDQAIRGRDMYLGFCKSCHSPESHTGATFRKWWAGRQLAELYTFVSTKMPKNEPASLAPSEYADVVAYLLKMNAMPAGPNELPPSVAELQKIRIATAPAKPKRTKS